MERPILFSGEMVRAILDGRKTQTRRVVNPQPSNPETFGISPVWGQGVHDRGDQAGRFCLHAAFNDGGKRVDRFLPCPYGAPGDLLWVRETFILESNQDCDIAGYEPPHRDGRPVHRVVGDEDFGDYWEQAHYAATDPKPELVAVGDVDEKRLGWKPSIHMPRWASRITLEVTDVRVERIRDISVNDALAEGRCLSTDPDDPEDFRNTWNRLNASRGFGWDANPWVWVVGFRRVETSTAGVG